MCLLIAKPAGAMLPQDWEDQCESAMSANPDGVGFAVYSPGMEKPRMARSIHMTPREFAELTAKHCEFNTEAVIHFRFGTSGGTKKELCHPFRLRDGSVFAHNGILPISPPTGMSDTAVLADSCGDFSELLSTLSTYASPSNKFAAIHRGGGLEIIGEDHGRWHGGIWYSNEHWRSYSGFGGFGGSFYDQSPDDLEWEEMQEIEDALADIVSRYGYKVVSEYLKLLKPTR